MNDTPHTIVVVFLEEGIKSSSDNWSVLCVIVFYINVGGTNNKLTHLTVIVLDEIHACLFVSVFALEQHRHVLYLIL